MHGHGMRGSIAVALIGAAIWTQGAEAGPPVAIVEEISAPSSTLRPLDYLSLGMRIELAEGETLTIGYFDSCTIEQIAGATVTIGERQSAVTGGGKLTRKFIQCGGAKMVLSGREAAQSAVVVTRAGPAAAETPALEVHSVYPLFVFAGPVPILELERLDRGGGERRRFDVQGARFDTAGMAAPLARGAVYRAKAGGRDLIFKVSDIARRDTGTALGRLVGFR